MSEREERDTRQKFEDKWPGPLGKIRYVQRQVSMMISFAGPNYVATVTRAEMEGWAQMLTQALYDMEAAALLRGQQVEPKEGDAHWRRGYNQGWDERKAFDERRVDAPPARQQDEADETVLWMDYDKYGGAKRLRAAVEATVDAWIAAARSRE